ncbi:flagellar hook-basal body complex protein [Clostridium oceanicum]|uniref:Flagellar basal-body rod protein FlgG n=1 Tax=Clostridium oceanicum TaxID=1543 RepID=A0ABP3V0M4_9CLOT
MLRSLWNSKTGLMAQQQKLDCISNNLANVNTVGYKRSDVNFQDLVYETLKRQGYPTSNTDPIQTGTGVKTSGWTKDRTGGSLLNTGNSTDLAIDGKGYFRVTLPNGDKAFTRAGDFIVDGAGDLVDKSGNKLDINLTNQGRQLLAQNGGFNQDNFVVSKDGTISLKFKGEGRTMPVGNIDIYNAVGDNAFISSGNNLYTLNPNANSYIENDFSIEQGFLENSNVDVGKEMTDMILTQRAFQLSSKGITTADEMWSMVNNMRK